MAPVLANVVASAYIKDGRLIVRHRSAFDQSIKALREGLEVELAVIPKRATRSLQQNAYYWGVVVELIAQHTGYTPDELHEVLKMKFIPKKVAIADGNGEIKGEFVLGGSTRKMNRLVFGEYMEDVRRWAATELDIVIPDPN